MPTSRAPGSCWHEARDRRGSRARGTPVNPFETETMAELCLRQGHRSEGLAIYQRLLARAADPPTRQRLGQRLAALEATSPGAAPVPTPAASASSASKAQALAPPPLLAEPGLRASTAGDTLTIDWRLPATASPSHELQLLLVLRTEAGVATETRSVPLDADAGRLDLHITGLHSARAAAGFRRDNRFVPILRAQA